jgi:hypothetical protein
LRAATHAHATLQSVQDQAHRWQALADSAGPTQAAGPALSGGSGSELTPRGDQADGGEAPWDEVTPVGKRKRQVARCTCPVGAGCDREQHALLLPGCCA